MCIHGSLCWLHRWNNSSRQIACQDNLAITTTHTANPHFPELKGGRHTVAINPKFKTNSSTHFFE